MSKFNFLIIEGIDNVGKGTLIDGLIERIGYHTVLKYSSPRKTCQMPIEYQRHSYEDGFNLMGKASELSENFVPNLIFDRFHLGEDVYSPMYRKYDGSYVFQLEKMAINQYPRLYDKIGVVFLRASGFSLIKDDGKSFDHSAGQAEQEKFLSAFQKCSLRKRIIDVHENFAEEDQSPVLGWRHPENILQDVLDFRIGIS